MVKPTTVHLQGVTFHGTVRPGFEGFALVDFEGWGEPPSMESESISTPGRPGITDAKGEHGARLVTMGGWFRVVRMEDMFEHRRAFAGLLSGGQASTLVVDELGETETATVRKFGEARFRRRGSTGFADWSLKVRAADPSKLGLVTEIFHGADLISHHGNYYATPTIHVTATTTMTGGYTIYGPGGRSYVVTQTLPAGSTHVIDMSTGWITLNGVQQIGAVSRADVWTIPPGAPQVYHVLVPTSGAGVLSTTVTDNSV
ncbi:phage distal tail protein [Microbacterium sp. Ag1]|uniref:phage distal tail protein n=1 Tax=Microbacterium sp. Ag1 TaxID=1643443 RepID=UPI000629811F|nr:phage tail domain-containing protein [Microbacterium sp. Ag1]KKX97742.1 hypothetical protein AAY78_11165 [Microbacterium sp. Ag1]